MTTPSRVRACAEQLAANNGAIDERIDRIDVRGTPDEPLRNALCAAAREWEDQRCGTFSALDALGDELTIEQLAATEGEVRIILGKHYTDTTYYCLTTQGLARLMDSPAQIARARRVLVAENFGSFRTVGCRFETWTEMVADLTELEVATRPVPRRIVRDQLAIVPLSLSAILLAEAPGDESGVFTVWRAQACPKLLVCLCDEIWRQEGELRVSLTGPRRRQIAARLDMVDPIGDFRPLTDAVDWVYNSGRDVETRHTLFIYELAREWPIDTPFALGFAERAAGALEAAKAAFRMHVRDASKETIKSLQELRKALADDVTRVVTQTRELSGTMWRDLLVVVAGVLGRFTLFSSPEPLEAHLADWLIWGLAAYLLFSIGMTAMSNASFMTIFRDTQTQWKTKLYGFIDPQDFQTLATDPLIKSEAVYRRTRNAAILAYALTIIGLIALAVMAPVNSPAGPQHGGGAISTIPAAKLKDEQADVSPNQAKQPPTAPGSRTILGKSTSGGNTP